MNCLARLREIAKRHRIPGDSAGQLLILQEIEKRTGKPGAFIETDLVDPRYFSAANVKNRLESYFQMIDQRRRGASAVA